MDKSLNDFNKEFTREDFDLLYKDLPRGVVGESPYTYREYNNEMMCRFLCTFCMPGEKYYEEQEKKIQEELKNLKKA